MDIIRKGMTFSWQDSPLDAIERVNDILKFLSTVACWPSEDSEVDFDSDARSGFSCILIACQVTLEEAREELANMPN